MIDWRDRSMWRRPPRRTPSPWAVFVLAAVLLSVEVLILLAVVR